MKFLVLLCDILLFLMGFGISNIFISLHLFEEPVVAKTEKELIEESIKEINNPPKKVPDYHIERRKKGLVLGLLLLISALSFLNFQQRLLILENRK